MDSLTQYWWAVPLGALLWLAFRKGPRNTPINWDTLATFLRDASQMERIDLSKTEKTDADVAVQFRNATDSVKYHRSLRRGINIETMDVLRRGEAGFVATFHDGVPTILTRIGGSETRNPHLNPGQETALLGLLRRCRKYASNPPAGHGNAL